MQHNLENQSVWRCDYVRLGVVLIVTCFVVVLALMIKIVILPNYSERVENEVLNNKTTPDNDPNRPTTEALTTHISMQTTSAVKDTELHTSSRPSPNQWIVDSHLATERARFAAVVMKNGEILVSGGAPSSDTDFIPLSSTEIYSPVNRKWRTVADMQLERHSHTLTALQDGKSILAIGAFHIIESYTAEIYDLETDRWTYLSNIMDACRCQHTATLLPNGQVLVVGGLSGDSYTITSSVQLYDPSSNTFIKTGSLNTERHAHTATLLSDGRSVLVTGGNSMHSYQIPTAEIYTVDSWSYTAGNLIFGRSDHAAVLLLDGNVLVAGGSDMNEYRLSFAEIYNSITRTFSPTASMKCARSGLTLTRLPSGQVLAAGGIGSTIDGCPLVSELYDPTTGQWTRTGALNTIHYDHATVLINNSVLVIGGYDHTSIEQNECERYDL